MTTTASELKSKLDARRDAKRREAWPRYEAAVERVARGDELDAQEIESACEAVGLTLDAFGPDVDHVAERTRLAGIVERGDAARVHSAVGLAKQLRDGLIQERAALDAKIVAAEQRVSDAERAASPVRRAEAALRGMEHLPSRRKVCPPQPQPVTPKAEPEHWRGLAAFFGRATPTTPDDRAALLRDAWHNAQAVSAALGRPLMIPKLSTRKTFTGDMTLDSEGWSRLDVAGQIRKSQELDAKADERAVCGSLLDLLVNLQAEVRPTPRKTMDLSGVAHLVRA